MPFKLRSATGEDAQVIAEVYFASFRLLTFLPMLHTLPSYRWYVANRMLKEWVVTVAETTPASSRFSAFGAKN
jgi:hypothetical protein